MAVKSNVDTFVRKLSAVSAAIPAAERAGVQAAAMVAKASILTSARSRRAKPRSRWVSVDQRGTTQNPAALLQLRGARAYWAERGTKAHDITPRRKKAILTPAGPRASAHVRGVKAKHFWAPGVQSAAKPAAAAHDDALRAALRQGFRG